MIWPHLFLTVFAFLLIAAAMCDLMTMEIPNRISILATLLFPAAAFIAGMPPIAIGLNLGIGFVVLVGTFFLFQANLLGGGDAKLLAAASIWMGGVALAPFFVWTMVCGGVLAIVILLCRWIWKPSENRGPALNRLLKPHGGLPYAVAIAAGGLIVLAQTPIAAAAR